MLQRKPCRYYREIPVGITGQYLQALQGFPCNFVLICFHLLQGLQDAGNPCYIYMQVTGQNCYTGIPCTHYREKNNSVPTYLLFYFSALVSARTSSERRWLSNQFVEKSIAFFQSHKLVSQDTAKCCTHYTILSFRRLSQHSNIKINIFHVFINFSQFFIVLFMEENKNIYLFFGLDYLLLDSY